MLIRDSEYPGQWRGDQRVVKDRADDDHESDGDEHRQREEVARHPGRRDLALAATMPRGAIEPKKTFAFQLNGRPVSVRAARGRAMKIKTARTSRAFQPRSMTSPMSTFAASSTKRIPTRIGTSVSLNSAT